MEIMMTTLNQMAFLFSLIVIGWILAKFRIVPENAPMTLSRLENNVFIPALVLGTFMTNFTVEHFRNAWQLLLVGAIGFLVALPLSLLFARICAKDRYIRKIYTYGLAFSNFGFVGNAVVSAIFPELFLDYLLFTLPLWVAIYLWGVPVLLLQDNGVTQTLRQRLRSFVNPMFLGLILGAIMGLSAIPLPGWLQSVVNVCGDCMSPVAMLLTGMTIAGIDMKKTLRKGSIYAVTGLRLLLIPGIFWLIFRFLPVSSEIVICGMCAVSMPLGLNTIVIPSAYGKDTSVASGMAIVSHALSCLTIPLVMMVTMLLV